MTGELDTFKENKMRLYPYLEGFAEWRLAYSRYPNALLALHFICGVGQKIMATLFTNMDSEDGEKVGVCVFVFVFVFVFFFLCVCVCVCLCLCVCVFYLLRICAQCGSSRKTHIQLIERHPLGAVNE